MKKMVMLSALMACTMCFALVSVQHLTAVITVTFTVDPEGAGDVLLSGKKTTSTQAFSGMNMTVSASVNPGYEFAGWYINDELKGTDASTFTFTTTESNMTVVAKYNQLAASNLTLAVKSGCEGMGTVGVSPGGTLVDGAHRYTAGTELTLKALPAKGYQFDRWELADGTLLSTAYSYTFTINSDMTVYGVFSEMPGYRSDLISFPGAEGYGRYATGGRMIDGRGSKVYYVTRLDDCSDNNLVEGTLRWALKTGDDTPRTVLFKVSGTIFLTSRLMGAKPNCTIAGQTAPGGGICIGGYQMKLSSNTIVRHIRFRAGDLPKKSMSQLDIENVQHVMLDHCSFSWSMEENLTMYDNNYTTVQWCISSEGLYNSRNTKGSRAYATQWGGEHSTMHHCLLAHCNSRSPRFNGVRQENHDRKVDSEFFNNVVYNWGKSNSLYGGENYVKTEEETAGVEHYDRIYMINNYFRPGPATKNATASKRYFVCPSGDINQVGQWYLKGNKFEVNSKWRGTGAVWNDAELEKVNADNYYGLSTNNNSRAINFSTNSAEMLEKALMHEIPYELSGVNIETADEAYQKVVRQAGASLPRYDEVDARILAEAAGTLDPQFGGARGDAMGIIDTPYDITLQQHDDFVALYEGDDEADNEERNVTCYPRLQMDGDDCRVQDADGDGLPDAYETSVGLNPHDATDGMALTASGYSNLEVFLNGVADGRIDARQFTKRQPQTGLTGFNAMVGEGEQFATIQAAIDAAPAGDTPYYIFIKKGSYYGHVQIDRPNIHLTGQNKLNTVITWDKTAAEGGVDQTATINVTAGNVSFDNLTIRNTRTNEGQALALYTKADRISITSCNLEGWQDTYRTGKDGHRHIVRNNKISGTTDFIYGAGEVFLDNDTLQVLRTSNVIVAPDHIRPVYGYVFRNAVIVSTAKSAATHLGRPWGNTPKVSYINTRLLEGMTIPAEGWIDMGGLPVQMAEYNTMDASGKAVDLSQRKTSFKAEGQTATSKAVLTPLEADGYKLDYMLRGTDEWDADWQAFILPAPRLSVNGTTVSWYDATGIACCYLVTVDGVPTVTTSTSIDADGQLVTVQVVSEHGVLGDIASSAHPTGIAPLHSGQSVSYRSFFTPDGRCHQRPQHGVNLIYERLSDGSQRTVKVVVR